MLRTGVPRAAFLCLLCLVCSLVTAPSPASAAGGKKRVVGPRLIIPTGWPKVVSIPRMAVQAPVEPLAFTNLHDQEAPYHWGDVAWYDRGPRPGEAGHANVFGHLDSYCCPAIFYKLKYLRSGDRVVVTYRDGQSLRFQVMWSHVYLNAQVPIKFLYGRSGQHGLILTTCTGIFHRDGTGYDSKLLVYARIIMPNGKLG